MERTRGGRTDGIRKPPSRISGDGLCRAALPIRRETAILRRRTPRLRFGQADRYRDRWAIGIPRPGRLPGPGRSEESSVGKEGVRKCRSGWLPYRSNKKNPHKKTQKQIFSSNDI